MNGHLVSDPQKPDSIDEWSQLLCEQEMPIFSNTANNIYASLDDKKKGAMELASIILQDPNLTAKLLKVSNSTYYNPSRQKINTVSRAIVILGAKIIRELTIACAFFESILSSDNKERANEEIGNAIHAAVQAKELAIAVNDPSPEEVFIAALLHNIGKIAFWCFNHKQGAQINDLLKSGHYTAAEAEKKILGFTLQQLSKKLGQTWHLGGLIEQAIENPDDNNRRIQVVRLGNEISLAVKSGKDSKAMGECLTKLTRLTGHTIKEHEARIKRNTAAAVKIAIQFGAHDASKFIDDTTPTLSVLENEVDEPHENKKQIQFQILQEISNHISGTINLNILFELILEGIFRGIGMDRTLFLLLSADKKTLNEKFSLGWKKAPETKIRVFQDNQPNLLFHCLASAESIWANPKQNRTLYNQQIMHLIGDSECFVIPVMTEQRAIGLLYCDRAITGAPLSIEDFNAAKHFAKQASIGLTLYRMRSC